MFDTEKHSEKVGKSQMCILNSTYLTFKLEKELQICKTGKDGMHVSTYILYSTKFGL